MKFYIIFFVRMSCILQLSDATILVKYGRVPHHYMQNEKKDSAKYDPLNNFGLQSRIQLCDAVLSAKQFITKHPACYSQKRFQESKVQLTKWNLPYNISPIRLNYQRIISSSRNGEDSSVLKYEERTVRMGAGEYRTMKRLQCVNTLTLKWFITFGLVDKFMYLIEFDTRKRNHQLRLVGILEPSALLNNREFEYFSSQLQTSRDEMESICTLGTDDRLRICSAIFDILNTEWSLERELKPLNYLKDERRFCVLRDIKIDGKIFQPYFLRCTTVREKSETEISTLYTLADSRERGAVFIFFGGRRGLLELHARVIKIGALLNPIGPSDVRLNPEVEPSGEGEGSNSGKTSWVSWREREEFRNKQRREKRAINAPEQENVTTVDVSKLRLKSKQRPPKRKRTPREELWEEEHETTSEEEYKSSDDEDKTNDEYQLYEKIEERYSKNKGKFLEKTLVIKEPTGESRTKSEKSLKKKDMLTAHDKGDKGKAPAKQPRGTRSKYVWDTESYETSDTEYKPSDEEEDRISEQITKENKKKDRAHSRTKREKSLKKKKKRKKMLEKINVDIMEGASSKLTLGGSHKPKVKKLSDLSDVPNDASSGESEELGNKLTHPISMNWGERKSRSMRENYDPHD